MNWQKPCTILTGTLLAMTLTASVAAGAATVNTSGDAKRPSKLILPSDVLARTGEVPVVYRLSQGFTGHAGRACALDGQPGPHGGR